jgi:hypothetical protein
MDPLTRPDLTRPLVKSPFLARYLAGPTADSHSPTLDGSEVPTLDFPFRTAFTPDFFPGVEEGEDGVVVVGLGMDRTGTASLSRCWFKLADPGGVEKRGKWFNRTADVRDGEGGN